MNATLERHVAERSKSAERRARALVLINEQLNREIADRERWSGAADLGASLPAAHGRDARRHRGGRRSRA